MIEDNPNKEIVYNNRDIVFYIIYLLEKIVIKMKTVTLLSLDKKILVSLKKIKNKRDMKNKSLNNLFKL